MSYISYDGDRGPIFFYRSLKLANRVGHINTVEPLQRNRKQFAIRPKRSPPIETGSCLDYMYKFILPQLVV